MTESVKVFTGSIPQIYDTYLEPLIFETYADDISERTAALRPRIALETAAGTRVVTRALASSSGCRRPLRGDRPEPCDAGSRRKHARDGRPDRLASGRRSANAF